MQRQDLDVLIRIDKIVCTELLDVMVQYNALIPIKQLIFCIDLECADRVGLDRALSWDIKTFKSRGLGIYMVHNMCMKLHEMFVGRRRPHTPTCTVNG